MNYKEIQEKINVLIGQKLTDVSTVCEMLCFYFDKGDGIHSLCLTRISKKDDLLLTTFDYQNWDEKIDSNNDERYYLKKFKKDIVGGIVTHVKVTPLKDLILYLDNDIVIEFFISNGYFHFGEENEQWRFMDSKENHTVINSKSVDYSPNKDNQSED